MAYYVLGAIQHANLNLLPTSPLPKSERPSAPTTSQVVQSLDTDTTQAPCTEATPDPLSSTPSAPGGNLTLLESAALTVPWAAGITFLTQLPNNIATAVMQELNQATPPRVLQTISESIDMHRRIAAELFQKEGPKALVRGFGPRFKMAMAAFGILNVASYACQTGPELPLAHRAGVTFSMESITRNYFLSQMQNPDNVPLQRQVFRRMMAPSYAIPSAALRTAYVCTNPVAKILGDHLRELDVLPDLVILVGEKVFCDGQCHYASSNH